MTWAGENPSSGIMIFTEDGSPGVINPGLAGQFLATNVDGGFSFKDTEENEVINEIIASGALLRVFGLNSQTTSMVNSTTYVPMADMTFLAPDSGTYFCLFNGSFTTNIGNKQIDIAIFVDDVLDESSERTNTVSASNKETIMSTSTLVEVSGNENIEIRWKTENQTTASVFGRTFSIISGKKLN